MLKAIEAAIEKAKQETTPFLKTYTDYMMEIQDKKIQLEFSKLSSSNKVCYKLLSKLSNTHLDSLKELIK